MAVLETGDLEYKHVKYVLNDQNGNKTYFRSSEYFPYLHRVYCNLELSKVYSDSSH